MDRGLRLIACLCLVLLLGGCEDPPPPSGMGAFLLGVRTVLPPADERFLRGGLREDLQELRALRAVATSVSVVHRTVRDDPSTERVIVVHDEWAEFELATTLEDGAPRILAFLNVPRGYVFQIRIQLESISIELGEETFPVFLPSGHTSGLKIESVDGEPFEIVAEERSGAQILFDPFGQMIRNRGRGFIFEPRIDGEPTTADDLLGFLGDQVVVGFDTSLTPGEIDAVNGEIGATIISCLEATNYCVMHLPIDVPFIDALEFYLGRGDEVRFALPNTFVGLFGSPTPNDPAFLAGDQSYLQAAGVAGTMTAPEAWDVNTGDAAVVVAVIDEEMGGMIHRDLIENIWINDREIPDRVRFAADGTERNLDIDMSGVITFADLDAWEDTLPPAEAGSVCPRANRIPIDKCDPFDLVNGGDPSDPMYGWQDSMDPDDGGRFPDDIVGWNFRSGTNMPSRAMSAGHSTWVAGTIGAVGNNGWAITGVAQAVRILPVGLRVRSPGVVSVEAFRTWRSDVIEALEYASLKDAHIANMSIGMHVTSDEQLDFACRAGLVGDPTALISEDALLRDGVNKFTAFERMLRQEFAEQVDSRMLVVVAAGNCDFGDLDRNDYFVWPGSMGAGGGDAFPSLISVGALDASNEMRAGFSGFGANELDIFAPGSNITVLQSSFVIPGLDPLLTDLEDGTRRGTSLAAPMVAGVAALVLSEDDTLRHQGCELADRLLRNAEQSDPLSGFVAHRRRLDARAAMVDDGSAPGRSCPP